MKKRMNAGTSLVMIILALLLLGCSVTNGISNLPNSSVSSNVFASSANVSTEDLTIISSITQEKQQLVEGLSAIRYEGDYRFDNFLESGGAMSDADVVKFLSLEGVDFSGEGFGCSTVSVRDKDGDALFGRNFDWQQCNAQIITSIPENGYSSISTINLDFLNGYSELSKEAQTLASLYAPLDGMNEKGLCVAVLMIEDTAVINQNTNKPDLTTTTAIRLLLDKAGNVTEAITLLEQYDMHSSMGMMVHFALSDTTGRSVVVEYVEDKMVVTQTPVVTNFYFAQGYKNGIGSSQSHTRYELLMKELSQTITMDMDAVRDAMDSVSKDNFGEFESTEWSIVYNQSEGEVRYYHRENYEDGFVFRFK